MKQSKVDNYQWQPPKVIKSNSLKLLLLLSIIIYLSLVVFSLDIDWQRIILGIKRSRKYFFDFLTPDFITRWSSIISGIIESLTMTYISTVIGVIISIPVALGAAKNISPLPIYYLCRGIIILARSFQEVIIAILFVVMIGLGPLAGILTLSFTSIGFIAKLLAEEIEGIDSSQVEAIKATGGSWLQVLTYGIIPQIMPRFIGLSVYRLDINFRASAIIGVVGAGGIGATLTAAFDRYDFSSASAILILMILIVLVGEYFSSQIRKKIQ